MRTAFLLITAVYAVLVVIAASRLPDRVPLHFGLRGTADQWGSRSEALVAFTLVGGGVAVLMGGLTTIMSRVPLRSTWVNLPHQDWWTATPEREARARERLVSDGYLIGAATMAVLCLALVLTLVAALGDEGGLPGGGWLIGGAVLALAALAIRLAFHYRPEDDS
ncbi:MAG: DUF1648 domain-containing protein [Nocardioides sp.]